MPMTIRQLDDCVENCDADLRRVNAEIEEQHNILSRLYELRTAAIKNRETWVNHPDRKRANA